MSHIKGHSTLKACWRVCCSRAGSPVTHSSTPPSMTQPMWPWCMRNLNAQCGDTAEKTAAQASDVSALRMPQISLKQSMSLAFICLLARPLKTWSHALKARTGSAEALVKAWTAALTNIPEHCLAGIRHILPLLASLKFGELCDRRLQLGKQVYQGASGRCCRSQ